MNVTLPRCGAFVALLLVALSGCATRPAKPVVSPPTSQAVLLVSIDAFRADYIDRGLTPNLAAMARDGVTAPYMLPSFPSLTFPNHYTLVTGRVPDRKRHRQQHDAGREAGHLSAMWPRTTDAGGRKPSPSG